MQGEVWAYLYSVGLGKDDRLCDLLPIRLITSIVFDLDMEI